MIFIYSTCTAQKKSKEHIDAGIKYYKSGEINLAINEFSKAINQNTKNYEGYYYRGQMYSLVDKFNEAITDFNITSKLNDTLYRVDYYLGYCYFKKGDTVKSIFYYDKCIKKKPDFFDALKNKTSILVNKRKCTDASELINKCIVLQPENEEINFYKGFCLTHSGDKKNALIYLEKSYNKNYQDVELFNCIGICYWDKGDLSKALLMLNKAINLDPLNGNYYLNRGLIYKDMGFKSSALKDLKKAIELGVVVTKELEAIFVGLKD